MKQSQFVFFSKMKKELESAPAEVKSNFNEVVKYFAGGSPQYGLE